MTVTERIYTTRQPSTECPGAAELGEPTPPKRSKEKEEEEETVTETIIQILRKSSRVRFRIVAF